MIESSLNTDRLKGGVVTVVVVEYRVAAAEAPEPRDVGTVLASRPQVEARGVR